MITGTNNSISNLKNLWIEMFMDKTNKVTNVADGSVLNATAYGTAKVAQKAIKDIAIVESQIFPESATGSLLDKSAALFGVTPRKGALGSSTYVRVMAAPGTVYDLSTYFIAKNGTRFIVDKPLTVDASGYGYVSVRSTVTGSATNVEANSITQVTPRPLQHIECTNEYQAVGGRDYEDDETFRIRIKNNDNKLSKGTIEYWTQVFQDLDPRVLRVMNVGLGEDAKTHIYLVTQNGSFFTEDELSTLLEKASAYFGLSEIDLSGNSIGIVLENAEWMYVGGATGIDFRVELTPGVDITTVRTNIQIALTKYLDFRFWVPGKSVQWDDLLQVVKTATGVKYVPDEYFNPFYDESVPLNQLPRIRGFVMRDLNGSVLFDSGMNLSNIFYPSSSSDIFTGQQSQTLSQTQMVQVTVTNTRGAVVVGATFTVGNKIVITNSVGQASLLLENGEYDYILDKPGWNERKGNFIVLNSDVFITINDFTAVQQQITFNVLQNQTPIQGAQILISNQTLTTNGSGVAVISIEPGTYSYTISKTGLAQVIGAVVVDNKPITITEYMFPQPQAVAFSVIDRERNIFVPEASVWIQDQTKDTDLNGQTEMGLTAGDYNMIVQKPGYLQYQKTIQISDTNQNCVLVELQPTPYQVTFTVLDINTGYPISAAAVSINGQNYQTNGQGIVIVSLISGTYAYTVFKSGYAQYTGSVIIDEDATGVIVRLDIAYQPITFIIRDIDSGALLSGALVSAGTISTFSDVNGEAVLMLANGTYSYMVSLSEYKDFTGSKTVLDEPSTETVFLSPRGHGLSFTVKDRVTSAALPQATVRVTNSGTGAVIATRVTNSDGIVNFDNIERGSYDYIVTKDGYIDSIGSFEMELTETSIEVLMDLSPTKLKVLTVADNEVMNDPSVPPIITGLSVEFTNTTSGEVTSTGPTTYTAIDVTLRPGKYSVKFTGPSIEETVQEYQVLQDEEVQFYLDLKKSVVVSFGADLSKIPNATPNPFFFGTQFNVALSREGDSSIEQSVTKLTSISGGKTIFPGNGHYLYGPPTLYKFSQGNIAPTEGSSFCWDYYQHTKISFTNNEDVISPKTILFSPRLDGILTMILKDDKDQYLQVGEVLDIVLTRNVTGDYPLTITTSFTSTNENGVIKGVLKNIPLGSYSVKVTPQNGSYNEADIFSIDLKHSEVSVSVDLVFPLRAITIVANVKRSGAALRQASVQIIDLPEMAGEKVSEILAFPVNPPQTPEQYQTNEYDIATLIPNGNWVTPTSAQLGKLGPLATAGTYQGVKGTWFGPTGSSSSLFFSRDVGIFNSYAGEGTAFYLSSNILASTPNNSTGFKITETQVSFQNLEGIVAAPIRPVKKPGWTPTAGDPVDYIEVPTGSGIYWAKGNITGDAGVNPNWRISTNQYDSGLYFQWGFPLTGYKGPKGSSFNGLRKVLSGPSLTNAQGQALLYPPYQEQPSNLNVLRGSYNKAYFQNIALTSNLVVDINVDPLYAIGFTISDTTGPIEGVSVEITSSSIGAKTITTNSSGYAQIEGLSAGEVITYNLKSNGYETQTGLSATTPSGTALISNVSKTMVVAPKLVTITNIGTNKINLDSRYKFVDILLFGGGGNGGDGNGSLRNGKGGGGGGGAYPYLRENILIDATQLAATVVIGNSAEDSSFTYKDISAVSAHGESAGLNGAGAGGSGGGAGSYSTYEYSGGHGGGGASAVAVGGDATTSAGGKGGASPTATQPSSFGFSGGKGQRYSSGWPAGAGSGAITSIILEKFYDPTLFERQFLMRGGDGGTGGYGPGPSGGGGGAGYGIGGTGGSGYTNSSTYNGTNGSYGAGGGGGTGNPNSSANGGKGGGGGQGILCLYYH